MAWPVFIIVVPPNLCHRRPVAIREHWSGVKVIPVQDTGQPHIFIEKKIMQTIVFMNKTERATVAQWKLGGCRTIQVAGKLISSYLRWRFPFRCQSLLHVFGRQVLIVFSFTNGPISYWPPSLVYNRPIFGKSRDANWTAESAIHEIL